MGPHGHIIKYNQTDIQAINHTNAYILIEIIRWTYTVHIKKQQKNNLGWRVS